MGFKTTLYQIIGSRIKKRRTELGLSQDDLATKIGIGRTSISNIEIGRHQVTLSVLYEICQILKTDVHFILPTYGEVNNAKPKTSDFVEFLNSEFKSKNIDSDSRKAIEDFIINLDKH